MVDANGVGVLVVEQRAGVAVRAAALLTPVKGRTEAGGRKSRGEMKILKY